MFLPTLNVFREYFTIFFARRLEIPPWLFKANQVPIFAFVLCGNLLVGAQTEEFEDFITSRFSFIWLPLVCLKSFKMFKDVGQVLPKKENDVKHLIIKHEVWSYSECILDHFHKDPQIRGQENDI